MNRLYFLFWFLDGAPRLENELTEAERGGKEAVEEADFDFFGEIDAASRLHEQEAAAIEKPIHEIKDVPEGKQIDNDLDLRFVGRKGFPCRAHLTAEIGVILERVIGE